MLSCQSKNVGVWILLIHFLNFIPYSSSKSKKTVCIIGAGPSGLASAKTFTKYLNQFDIIVFEKNSEIGGQWLYTDFTHLDIHGLPVHSSIWKNMKTNLWANAMMFPDYPIQYPDLGSYIKHEVVLEYLKNYTHHFNLRQYIQFNTLVSNVKPDGVSAFTDFFDKFKKKTAKQPKKWIVQTHNFDSNTNTEILCDAVMVCNGHLSKPHLPQIYGIFTFPGKIIHGHSYRAPEDYTNKTVLILGKGDSATGISIDLEGYAKKVYVSHHSKRVEKPSPHVVEIESLVIVDGSLLILNNKNKIRDVDEIILCTGYDYDLAFLDDLCGLTVLENSIEPLDGIFNLKYPTMSFIGLHTHVFNYFEVNDVLRTLLESDSSSSTRMSSSKL